MEVEQDQQKVTLSKIYTYGLSPCHLFLLNGYYNDKPFAYLNHHAFWMKAKKKEAHARPASLLQDFVRFLKRTKDTFSKSEEDLKVQNFNNLKLLVGASQLSNIDGNNKHFHYSIILAIESVGVGELLI